MIGRWHIFLHVTIPSILWSGLPVFALAIVLLPLGFMCGALCSFLFSLLIINYRSRVDGILYSLGFLFEVVLFVNVLYDLFILILYIFYLFLQVLELGVESFDLLGASGVAYLPHRLGYSWICWRIQLSTDSSSSLFHLIILISNELTNKIIV